MDRMNEWRGEWYTTAPKQFWNNGLMQTDLTHNPTITFLQCLGRNDRLLEDQAEKGAKDNEQSIILKVKSHKISCTARNKNCPIWHPFWLTSQQMKISYQIDGFIHLSVCQTCSSSHQPLREGQSWSPKHWLLAHQWCGWQAEGNSVNLFTVKA